MRIEHTDLALPSYLGGIAPFIVGLCVGGLLIAAFFFGQRYRAQEPPPPSQPQRRSGAWQTREEHESGPSSPDHGPGHDDNDDAVGYVTEHHESDRLQPEADGERVLPHEIRNPGAHPEELSDERKKWPPGSSGSFGSGGSGRH
ncbi:hypothetical protein VR41_01545 [Streptomyces sp. NRRL B-1568]|uniref:Secreted protein n=1 Tax=Streptomyces olivoverticillatus TaxID=66427 RepID=A0A7W7LQX0_9ACTN|nr:DUF6479 family protein [Streptomyces olivoverticillatus]KJY43793.1 hypothetical protein VR41_01545 [Streptomyces sp. NRRL B-1568]MBB4894789.1 hypothetical protein [Streptomyces olivoverticillatus]